MSLKEKNISSSVVFSTKKNIIELSEGNSKFGLYYFAIPNPIIISKYQKYSLSINVSENIGSWGNIILFGTFEAK